MHINKPFRLFEETIGSCPNNLSLPVDVFAKYNVPSIDITLNELKEDEHRLLKRLGDRE